MSTVPSDLGEEEQGYPSGVPLWLMTEEQKRAWWEAKFPGGPPGEDPTERREREQVSRFESATRELELQTPGEMDLEELLRQAGVDLTEQAVRNWMQQVPDNLPVETLTFYIAQLAERYPAVPVTAYSQALEASGFNGPLISTEFATAQLAGTPGYQFQGAGGFSVQPNTGWIQYNNGVLVNPADETVVFDPTSSAPGSPNWLQQVQQSWSPEQVAQWKDRLKEYGYLSKDQAKAKGIDQAFLDGLRAYHMSRYLNFGKAVPTDIAAIGGAGGAGDFNLTARDFQAQIRNDVREQFRRVFGNDPSDGELADWTRFVTQTSIRAQRVFKRRGAEPSTALSLAATEAEERFVERLETSPEAEFFSESIEENTRLRDALASAVVTTRSLVG